MFYKVLQGALIPFLGTATGSLISFFKPLRQSHKLSGLLQGSASGVMVAASVWSLLLPSLEYSAHYGSLSFVPAVAGLIAGFVFMICSEGFIKGKSKNSPDKKRKLMFFAVTLHNIPEGMAIGAAYSAAIVSGLSEHFARALVLCTGIAIQNIPEGAIVALPDEKDKNGVPGFFRGVLSGVVEPVAVILTVVLSSLLVPVLPFFLSFAAGSMLYVVLSEMSSDLTPSGFLSFAAGFSLMMSLDVALG